MYHQSQSQSHLDYLPRTLSQDHNKTYYKPRMHRRGTSGKEEISEKVEKTVPRAKISSLYFTLYISYCFYIQTLYINTAYKQGELWSFFFLHITCVGCVVSDNTQVQVQRRIIFTITINSYQDIHPERQNNFTRSYYVFLTGYFRYLLKHLNVNKSTKCLCWELRKLWKLLFSQMLRCLNDSMCHWSQPHHSDFGNHGHIHL